MSDLIKYIPTQYRWKHKFMVLETLTGQSVNIIHVVCEPEKRGFAMQEPRLIFDNETAYKGEGFWPHFDLDRPLWTEPQSMNYFDQSDEFCRWNPPPMDLEELKKTPATARGVSRLLNHVGYMDDEYPNTMFLADDKNPDVIILLQCPTVEEIHNTPFRTVKRFNVRDLQALIAEGGHLDVFKKKAEGR